MGHDRCIPRENGVNSTMTVKIQSFAAEGKLDELRCSKKVPECRLLRSSNLLMG